MAMLQHTPSMSSVNMNLHRIITRKIVTSMLTPRTGGHNLRRSPERRYKCPRHIPPHDTAWCVGADHSAALPAICNGEAVVPDERKSVPPGSAAEALERTLCTRLQRNQGIRGSEEPQA